MVPKLILTFCLVAVSHATTDDGATAFERGDYSGAARYWENAAKQCRAGKDEAGLAGALIHLGAAYGALGQQSLAVKSLEEAEALANRRGDKSLQALAKGGLGRAYATARRADLAEPFLRDGLALAKAADDSSLTAALQNDWGNLLADAGRTDEALQQFQSAVELAKANDDAVSAARALCNAAATAATASRVAEADNFNTAALDAIARLPASHEKALLLNRSGQTDWQVARHDANERDRRLARAEKSHREALEIAGPLHDRRTTTFALGYLGQVHESRQEWDRAMEATRRAAFVAQQIPSPHALYRWEWQTGRLFAAQNDLDSALPAYRRALQSLRQVRHDLTAGCLGRATFREAVGPVFFEAADLLLRRAKTESDKARRESLLVETRDTLEQLKSAELEDYFRDECANAQLSRAARIERVDPATAVIYIIPLADRTELLLGFRDGFEQAQSPARAAELTEAVRKFRAHLEKRSTDEYLLGAQQLHEWLIAPIEPTLRARGVKTLVFVPDGALRSIPMAALHDGARFLVERYAIAVTPGLALLEPRPFPRERAEVLLAGISESVQDFPPLEYVPTELDHVRQMFPGRALLNGQFRVENLRQKFRESQYQVVHFASHGEFDRDSGRSFILTYDERLSLDQLEELIRPSQFRGKPVELLTLSACQTAAGDDRAALGLAGVAVKAGARSALATLWYVNDASTATLVQEFYSQFRQGRSVSKAEALRQAQLKLIADRRHVHPCYWGAFLIIGNWL